MSPYLSPRTRASNLAQMGSNHLDLLVVGGGISGAGIAAEAAGRGLSVALVERLDFASGTSSKSSKLLHGGLRYLEQYHFKLVHEAVGERNRLLRQAPQLAREVPFLFPVEPGRGPRMLQMRAGLTIYDLMSLQQGGPLRWWHKVLDSQALGEAEPCLAKAHLQGALRYFDAQVDDARLVMDVIKTASASGAIVANYCPVQGFLSDSQGRAIGAEVEDRLTGARVRVHARRIVNAAGPWVDALNLLDDPASPRRLMPTKGVHVIVPAFTKGEALVIQSLPHADGRRRWMFVIPWGDRSIIGTTDTAHPGYDKGDRYLDEDTEATAPEVEYLLGSVNAACPGTDLRMTDVISAYGGYRPLIAPAGQTFESDISREHEIFETPSGIVCIAGGKLTTYRVMARQVVDRAVHLLRKDGLNRPLHSCQPPVPFREPLQDVQALAQQSDDLARPIAGLSDSASKLRADVVHAVRSEMALSVSDVLARRTRVQLLDDRSGLDAAEEVTELIASELADFLDWDGDRRKKWVASELEAYQTQVRRMLAFRSRD